MGRPEPVLQPVANLKQEDEARMIPQDSGNPGTFVISDADTLACIMRHTAHFLGRGAYRHIEVALPVAQRERFERRINARYRACGCFESAIAVLLTVAALVIWNVGYPAQPGYAWDDFALDLVIALLAGAGGKVLAMVRAHFALASTLRELESTFAAHNNEGELNERMS